MSSPVDYSVDADFNLGVERSNSRMRRAALNGAIGHGSDMQGFLIGMERIAGPQWKAELSRMELTLKTMINRLETYESELAGGVSK